MVSRLPLALAAGVVLATAMPPTQLVPALLGLVLAFHLIASATGPKSAFFVGASTAAGFFTLHVLWLPASFGAFFGPAFWATYPAMIAALAAIWGANAAFARWAGRGGHGTLLVLATSWVAVEWLRSIGFLGFPWGTLGYAWLDTGLAQWADVIGVHGLSLATTLLAASFAWPFVGEGGTTARRHGPSAADLAFPVALAVLTAAAWWGGLQRAEAWWWGHPDIPLRALLVQGNVDPFGRAISANQELGVHVALTAQGIDAADTPPDLIVWPEGAVIGFPLEGFRGEPARRAITEALPDATYLVGGRARVEGGGANAVYALRGDTVLGRYDKHVLVPFGERWPWLDAAAPVYRAIFSTFGLPMLTNTVPGEVPTPLPSGIGSVAAYVCYESVFPYVARTMVAHGAGVLVNVTNDAWFARGAGAEQHFDMGRMRAIETRRWLVRAGNDGITGAVDPTGTVRATLPRRTEGTLEVAFATSDVVTPYVRYGAWTPWIAIALVALTWTLAATRRSTPSRSYTMLRS